MGLCLAQYFVVWKLQMNSPRSRVVNQNAISLPACNLVDIAYKTFCFRKQNTSDANPLLMFQEDDFKASMNIDILLSIWPLSKTGYWLGECHGWLHLHELRRAARRGSENYKIKNSYPQRDSNSRSFDNRKAMKPDILSPTKNLT